MSKKDYELIASVLRDQRRNRSLAERDLVDQIIRKFAVELMNTNARFNMPKFLEACESGFVY
jgi:exoribonuclease II